MEEMMLRLIGALAMTMLSTVAFAQGGKGIRFWNLTPWTVDGLQLSAPGQNAWGPNQCQYDSDGAVDHDERLKMPRAQAGNYDVKLRFKDGKTCVAKNIEIKADAVFSIDEKALTDCSN
jgi:hypothetical protein